MKKYGIKQKIMVFPFLIFVILILINLLNEGIRKSIRENIILPSIENAMMNEIKVNLKAVTDNESLILSNEVKNLVQEEKINHIRKHTDNIFFFDDLSGYFFSYTTEGIRINVPTEGGRKDNGKDLSGLKDSNGIFFIQKMIDIVKKDKGGFVEYYFPKPNGVVEPKLAYVKLIEGTNIFIGTGIYYDSINEAKSSINKSMKEKERYYNIMVYVVVLALLLVVMLISYIVIFSINNAVNKITIKLKESSSSINIASNELSNVSQDLASSSGEQAASIEETSATLFETSTMIKRSADNTNNVSKLSVETTSLANVGNKEMGKMLDFIQNLRKSSNEVHTIIKVIDDIAFQTNILSLNAAVEAARAGEYGAGFAVVAEEVRNLAQRSAEAAKDTEEKIESNVKISEESFKMAETVSVRLKEIVENVSKIDSLMEEIKDASFEQSRGVEQINLAVNQMETVTQTIASTAREGAATAEELDAQSNSMAEIVMELEEIVNGEK